MLYCGVAEQPIGMFNEMSLSSVTIYAATKGGGSVLAICGYGAITTASASSEGICEKILR